MESQSPEFLFDLRDFEPLSGRFLGFGDERLQVLA